MGLTRKRSEDQIVFSDGFAQVKLLPAFGADMLANDFKDLNVKALQDHALVGVGIVAWHRGNVTAREHLEPSEVLEGHATGTRTAQKSSSGKRRGICAETDTNVPSRLGKVS